MKIILSTLAILIVVFWGYFNFQRERKKQELKKSTSVIEAPIVQLKCKRKGNVIKFRVDDKIFIERIYLSLEECSELSSHQTIAVKMDVDGNIVFANDNYNDSSEWEVQAIVLVGLSLIGVIAYYGFIPRRLTAKGKNRNKRISER